jgi:hypothetical protein
VEGDGSFSVRKLTGDSKYYMVFSISQSATDIALLTAIQNHLNGLLELSDRNNTSFPPLRRENTPFGAERRGGEESLRNFVTLSSSTYKSVAPNKKYNLSIQDFHYLKDVLIPYLDSLVFRTKKQLDYIDLKNILNLKDKGFLYTKPPPL